MSNMSHVKDPQSETVTEFLRRIQLKESQIKVFIAEEFVDITDILKLKSAELAEMGFKMGSRKAILRKISGELKRRETVGNKQILNVFNSHGDGDDSGDDGAMLYTFEGVILFLDSVLLVGGYIREMTQSLVHEYIIPVDVHAVCVDYFYYPTAMVVLTQLRQGAQQLNDEEKILKYDKLMLNKCCETAYSHETGGICLNILNCWKKKGQPEIMMCFVYQCALRCIMKDNSDILMKILGNYIYDDLYDVWDPTRMDEIMNLVNQAAKLNSFRCIDFLLSSPDRLNWIPEIYNPTILWNTIKYQRDKTGLIELVIDRLKCARVTFECNLIMEDVIRFDLVEVAKRIVENRWHYLTPNDMSLAESLDANCYKWMLKRREAFGVYCSDEEVEWEE